MSITLGKAIEGFMLEAQARRLSLNTLRDYQNTYRQMVKFFDDVDPLLCDIGREDVRHFMVAQADRGLSKKSVLNAHIALSSLWHWAVNEGYADHNVIREVKPPKPETRAIEPFSRQDIKALLQAARSARNRAIILVLLDCCVRASELTGLHVRDCDLRNRRIKLTGKGDKDRYVSFVPETGRAIWRYLATREAHPDDPLFATRQSRPIDRHELVHILSRIGKRAGVANVYPHRFRHTGAIQHLRNGMPAPVVQEMLGHSSMATTRRYLNLAGLDMASIHQHSSPVANWDLRG